jgi:hypothetical protein
VDAKATREHFERGVAAYNEQRFSDAAEEFDTAYKISRAFKILFNIGQVDTALGRSVEAVEAYDAYLKQGGATITAERRKEVQIEIEHQLARIGYLSIRTSPPGADVRLDGVTVGKSPLPRSVRVRMGRHSVEAILAGHVPAIRELDVAGRAEVTVDLSLEPFVEPQPPTPHPAPTPAPAPVVVPVVTFWPPPPTSVPSSEPAASPGGKTPPAPVEKAGAHESSVNWQRLIGCVVMVGGLGTATIGGLLAYKGSNQSNEAHDRLDAATNAGDAAAYDQAKPDFDAGRRRNELGWTVAGIGAAGLLGGVVLVATAPERRAASLAFTPWMTATRGGLGLAFSSAW